MHQDMNRATATRGNRGPMLLSNWKRGGRRQMMGMGTTGLIRRSSKARRSAAQEPLRTKRHPDTAA